MLGDDPEKIKEEFEKKNSGDLSALSEAALKSSVEIEYSRNSLRELKLHATEYIEKKTILHALEINRWNKSEAAKMLKISYKTLFTKMSDFGIEK